MRGASISPLGSPLGHFTTDLRATRSSQSSLCSSSTRWLRRRVRSNPLWQTHFEHAYMRKGGHQLGVTESAGEKGASIDNERRRSCALWLQVERYSPHSLGHHWSGYRSQVSIPGSLVAGWPAGIRHMFTRYAALQYSKYAYVSWHTMTCAPVPRTRVARVTGTAILDVRPNHTRSLAVLTTPFDGCTGMRTQKTRRLGECGSSECSSTLPKAVQMLHLFVLQRLAFSGWN